MSRIYLILLLLAVLTVYCTTEEGRRASAYENVKTNEHQLQMQIADGKSPYELTDDAHRLINSYISFYEEYPEHHESPEFLFQAGMVNAELLGDSHEGIRLLKKVQQDYKEHDIAQRSLFLAGFIYDYELEKADKAREVYTKFLEVYPHSELADAVRHAREFAGSDGSAEIPIEIEPNP